MINFLAQSTVSPQAKAAAAKVVAQAVQMAEVQVFTASMLVIGTLLVLIATILFSFNLKRTGLITIALYGATTWVIPSVYATFIGIVIASTSLIAVTMDILLRSKNGKQ